MRNLEIVNKIVVHCADSKSDMNVTVDDLRKWHVTEKGWSDIGYHYFIKFDGSVYDCRSVKFQGAHCIAVNNESIAICIEGGYGGEYNFTKPQMDALGALIENKKTEYPGATLHGHNEFDNKSCPCFNVGEWYTKYLEEQVNDWPSVYKKWLRCFQIR